jgi:putative redox protein
MHATARRGSGPLSYRIGVRGHVIRTDEPCSIGGEDRAPTPHELLPAALAGCVATMIELYARRKGWALGGVEVAVDYEPDDGRFDVHIHIPMPLSDEQCERLERVAQTCPVRRALTSDLTVVDHLVHGQQGIPHAA